MDQQITIRRANSDDASMIADISRLTFYETFAAANTPENMEKFMNEQFTKEKLMAEVGTPENIFLIAYLGDEVAGYLRLREGDNPKGLNGDPSLEIVRIYAMPDKIGKGVGKKLMEASIDIAKEKGKKALWLGVWENNQRAIDFYTKWGFQKFSEHAFMLGNEIQTDWLMKKPVN